MRRIIAVIIGLVLIILSIGSSDQFIYASGVDGGSLGGVDSYGSSGGLDDFYLYAGVTNNSFARVYKYIRGRGWELITPTPVSHSEDVSIDSPHPYPNYYDRTWIITRPGAGRIRVHFSLIESEVGYDYIYVMDGNDVIIHNFSGSFSDVWSDWIVGSTVKIRLVTDSNETYYGFTIDKLIWIEGGIEAEYAVLTLIEYNDSLYAGTMSSADSMYGVGRVYRYDGLDSSGMHVWTLVGDNLDNQVSSLVVFNGSLYAGTAWGSGKLYRFDGVNNWTLVVDYPDWGGFWSAYVWNDKLLLGDVRGDKIGFFNGTDFTEVMNLDGSCIYDFEYFGGYLYAGGYDGRLFRSIDGYTWNTVLNYPNGNLWELEVFKGYLYLGFDNGELQRFDGYIFDSVWAAPDGIISMVASENYLFLGTGGAAGAYLGSSLSGVGVVYQFDGSSVEAISPVLGEGVQTLYVTKLPPNIVLANELLLLNDTAYAAIDSWGDGAAEALIKVLDSIDLGIDPIVRTILYSAELYDYSQLLRSGVVDWILSGSRVFREDLVENLLGEWRADTEYSIADKYGLSSVWYWTKYSVDQDGSLSFVEKRNIAKAYLFGAGPPSSDVVYYRLKDPDNPDVFKTIELHPLTIVVDEWSGVNSLLNSLVESLMNSSSLPPDMNVSMYVDLIRKLRMSIEKNILMDVDNDGFIEPGRESLIPIYNTTPSGLLMENAVPLGHTGASLDLVNKIIGKGEEYYTSVNYYAAGLVSGDLVLGKVVSLVANEEMSTAIEVPIISRAAGTGHIIRGGEAIRTVRYEVLAVVEAIKATRSFIEDSYILCRVLRNLSSIIYSDLMGGSVSSIYGTGEITLVELNATKVSTSFYVLELPETRDWVIVNGSVSVKNYGYEYVPVTVYITVSPEAAGYFNSFTYGYVNGNQEYVILGPGESATFNFSIVLFRNSVINGSHGYLISSYAYIGLARLGPKTIKLSIGLFDETNFYYDEQVKLLASSSISEGQRFSLVYVPPENTSLSIISLVYSGSDLDLHVYDESGNHVGMNYTTGVVDNEIPGAEYSGPDSPVEWVRLTGDLNHVYTVVVVAVDVDGFESFNIVSTESQPARGVITILPTKIGGRVTCGKALLERITIRELTGISGVDNISISYGDLSSDGGTVIDSKYIRINISGFSVMPGAYSTIYLEINLPENMSLGAYMGEINITTPTQTLLIPINITVIDDVPPVVDILSPRNNSYVRESVSIDVFVYDSRFDRAELYINGQLVHVWSEAGLQSYIWDTRGYKDGQYLIGVKVYDEVGNLMEENLTVIVDNTKPSVAINQPSMGDYVRSMVNINLYGYDSNLERIELYIEGELVASWSESGSYTYYWDTTKYWEGTHLVKVVAYDKAGNIGETIIFVTIDNSPPSIGVFYPRDGAFVSGLSNIEFYCFDVNIGFIEMYVDQYLVYVSNSSGYHVYTLDSSRLTDGMHMVVIRAGDRAGNYVEMVINIVVDNTPPSVKIISPSEGVVIGRINISWSVSDENLYKVILFIDSVSVDVTGNSSYSWDTLGLHDGIHVIKVVARDVVGNTASEYIEVYILNERYVKLQALMSMVGDYINESKGMFFISPSSRTYIDVALSEYSKASEAMGYLRLEDAETYAVNALHFIGKAYADEAMVRALVIISLLIIIIIAVVVYLVRRRRKIRA